MMAASGMSRGGLYCAAKAASRLNEGMFVSFYLMDEFWRGGAPRLIETPLPEDPMPRVGVLLGAAYDQHTREGLAAIGKFFKTCDALAPFLEATPEERRKAFQRSGVFLAEGGLLKFRIAYGRSEEVRNVVRAEDTRYPWLPDTLRGKYLGTIRENLGHLNTCREQVLWAKQNA